jgi:hypothetical protein
LPSFNDSEADLRMETFGAVGLEESFASVLVGGLMREAVRRLDVDLGVALLDLVALLAAVDFVVAFSERLDAGRAVFFAGFLMEREELRLATGLSVLPEIHITTVLAITYGRTEP